MKLIVLAGLVLAVMVMSLSQCHSSARASETAALSVSQGDPITGLWNVTFYVKSHPATPATFELKLEGTKVTGTANSDHTGPGTVKDGTWENGKLSMTLEFKKHESILVSGALQDSKLVGEFRTEGFVSNWEGKKKE